jgi:hypothetical protein
MPKKPQAEWFGRNAIEQERRPDRCTSDNTVGSVDDGSSKWPPDQKRTHRDDVPNPEPNPCGYPNAQRNTVSERPMIWTLAYPLLRCLAITL